MRLSELKALAVMAGEPVFDVPWMSHGCTMDVPSMSHGCPIDVHRAIERVFVVYNQVLRSPTLDGIALARPAHRKWTSFESFKPKIKTTRSFAITGFILKDKYHESNICVICQI